MGETLELESYIDSLDNQAVQYHSVASIAGEPVFTIDGALGPLLPMTDFIDEQTIRQQFAEIYRPSDAPLELRNTAIDLPFSPFVPMTFDRICAHEPGVGLLRKKK